MFSSHDLLKIVQPHPKSLYEVTKLYYRTKTKLKRRAFHLWFKQDAMVMFESWVLEGKGGDEKA
jgi:hypothetical protein